MDLLAPPRALFAAGFGLVALVRRAPALHPRGTLHTCVLRVDPGRRGRARPWGTRLLDRPARHRGVVRVSRSVGFPRPLPDVDGIAVRLPGLGVGGAPLDLLLVSAWRFVFAPSLVARRWSCILPYRTGTGRVVLLGGRPRAGGFELLTAAPFGRWRHWAELDVGKELPGGLRTVPTVGAADLQPVRTFRRLRAWAYRASQAVR